MRNGIFQFDFTRHGRYLRSKVPYIRTEDACGFIAYNTKSEIVGAVIFDNFLFSSVQVTLIIDSPQAIKIGLLDFAADFAFNVMNKKYAYAMVSEKNTRSLRLCKRVGFVEQLRIPEGCAQDKDMIVLRLDADKLNMRPRKERQKYANA